MMGLKLAAVGLLTVGLLSGCTSQTWLIASAEEAPPGSVPPDAPEPVSDFEVEFVPSTSEPFPSTELREVPRYRVVHHWPGSAGKVKKDSSPDRPYVVVGELLFEERWYHDAVIDELLLHHVQRVGGHAVLVYEAHQTAAAQHEETGANAFFQSMTAAVIRYTD
jgi:hypothetical protein